VQATFLGISDGEIYDLFALNAMKVSSPSDARRINFEENNLQLHKVCDILCVYKDCFYFSSSVGFPPIIIDVPHRHLLMSLYGPYTHTDI